MRGNCRSCGARISWMKTDKGGTMPLDPDPVPDGNVIIVAKAEPRWTAHLAHVLSKDEAVPEGTKRYVSHFATCPQAAEHRRRA